MALIPFLQSKNVTHLLLLQSDSEVFDRGFDYGNSPDPTRLRTDQYNAQWDMTGNPVCEGVTGSILAFGVNTDFTTKVFAGEIDNRADINANNGNLGDSSDNSSYNWNTGTRLMSCWFRQKVELDGVPTAVLGHGGGTNNHIITVRLGGKIVFQSADAGQPYLAKASYDDFQVGRCYFVGGLWEHHTQHSGAGNKITLIVNGVSQGSYQLTGTDAMAGATGPIFVGNAQSNYKSYGEGTIGYLRREKEVNLVGFYNNVYYSENSNTVDDLREMFERTLIPEITIESDTVENQQIALDNLIGNSYLNVNCAIRILQATDATDYRLFLDDIEFPNNPNLGDISIQFVGTGSLTVENVNGSNATLTSTPVEVEKTTGIITGGGSITVLTDNRIRLNSLQNLDGVTADKVIIENSGSYVFSNSFITEVENVSGGDVDITTDNPVINTINTNAGSQTNYIDSFLSFTDIETWELYPTLSDQNAGTNLITSGNSSDVYRFTYSGITTFYLRLIKSGTVFLNQKEVNTNGETNISLSQEALLSSIASKIDVIPKDVWEYEERTLNKSYLK